MMIVIASENINNNFYESGRIFTTWRPKYYFLNFITKLCYNNLVLKLQGAKWRFFATCGGGSFERR